MVKLFVSGDVVNYNKSNGLLCSDALSNIIRNADYSVCNFEAPVNGHGFAQLKVGPHHSQNPETVLGLKAQGFNLLLLANNHIMDYGEDGLIGVCTLAANAGIDVVGAGATRNTAYMPLIKEINGMKIGIINGAEAQFGVIDDFDRPEKAGYAWINSPLIDKCVIELKQQCDFVLVFAHAGLENVNVPQKIWRDRYKQLCRLGADAVVGSHPHTPQGYERYRDSVIFYSLGNFYFDGGGYKSAKNSSFAIELNLVKGSVLEFNPVFHETIDGVVCISAENKECDLANLCSLLGEGYSQLNDDINVSAYESLQKQLVMSVSPIPTDGSFLGTCKAIVASLLGRRKYFDRKLLLLHLFRNETYRYAIQHSLEVINRLKNI